KPGAEGDQRHRQRREPRPRLPRLQHAIVAARARDAVHRVVISGDARAAARQVEPARRIGDAQAASHAPQLERFVYLLADHLELAGADEQRYRLPRGSLAVVVVGADRRHMPRSTLKRSPISWPVAPTRGSRPLAWCTVSASTSIARQPRRLRRVRITAHGISSPTLKTTATTLPR